MIINITYDSSVATNPNEAAFKATVQGVANFYESQFSNPITINWDVGWGEVNGSSIPSGGGAESESNYAGQFTYSQLKAAFTADNDTTALASLPASDPTSGGDGGFSMTTAEAKTLGLVSANNSAIDGWSGLDSTSTWVYNTTNTTGSDVPAGDLDAFSFLAHELSEVMGRQMNFGAGSNDGFTGDGYYPEDLFDYTANGVRALTNSATKDRYFSIDGGKTNTAQHYFNNVANNGDLFDYIPNGTAGSFLPSGSPDSFDYEGSVGIVSAGDLTLMQTLGYTASNATIHWAKQVSGSFATAVDWTGGVVPGASNGAALDASGSTRYTVTSSASETVASLQTASTATLAITGGTFTAAAGTGGGSSAGAIAVSGGSLVLGGKWNATGDILVTGTGLVRVASGGVTLTGTGGIHLNGDNEIKGLTSTATLTNLSRILGAGEIGGGELNLINSAGAYIEANGSDRLTIDTAGNTVMNAGVIEAVGTGGLTISHAVSNTGRLIAVASLLTVSGAVSGAGTGVVENGVLDAASTFNENVTFTSGATGTLELAKAYTGTITGFSATGTNALDLSSVTYTAGTTTAAFTGATNSGTLTVLEGATVAATIKLTGNYVGDTFTTSAGIGGVGTKIVAHAPTKLPPATAAPAFVAAMASFAPEAGGQTHAPVSVDQGHTTMIAAPRFMQA